MRISNEGLAIIKKYEGCKLSAYKCPAGVWTIGYGHTGGVKQGDKITQAQAELYLLADLERFEKNVEKYNNRYKWTQNEFDAMVSFAYNLGSIDKLTAGGTRTKQIIAEKILLYNKAGGQVLAGLTKRRTEEQALFLKGSVTTEQSGIVEYSLARDGNKYIAKNFQVEEFCCKDGSDKILIDVDFVKDKLQKIRDHFGVPVTFNSAYRTQRYNDSLPDSAKKSYHLTGQAFDIVVKGKAPAEVARYAQSIGIKGIIQYNNFVHVDSRSEKYWVRNDNGKVTLKSSF